ncbi:Uncharacterised protein [Shigella sonnei]|nr:Uncharacterised protein [Shigella sonnei]CSI48991.1 Uncharacterised protein [Shigella sonnei]
MAILKSITNTKTVKIREGYPSLCYVLILLSGLDILRQINAYYTTVDACLQNTFGGLSKHQVFSQRTVS